MKIRKPQEPDRGIETPIPPIAMNARRPEGRPAAGITTVEKVITGFHCSGAKGSYDFSGAVFFYWYYSMLFMDNYRLTALKSITGSGGTP